MGDEEYITIFSRDKLRSKVVPARLPPERWGKYSGEHFEDDEFIVLYDESGRLFEAQDSAIGKKVWPEKIAGPQFTLRPDNSTVYFVQAASGEVKIGIAKDVSARLKSLQTGCPSLITLLTTTAGGQMQERAYHAQFAEHRLHGEWFAPHPDILAEIARLSAIHKDK